MDPSLFGNNALIDHRWVEAAIRMVRLGISLKLGEL